MKPQARPFAELRMAMSKYGLKQKEIAKQIGVGATYVSDRLNGKHAWSLKDIQMICDYLEIPENETYKYFPLSDVRGRDCR